MPHRVSKMKAIFFGKFFVSIDWLLWKKVECELERRMGIIGKGTDESGGMKNTEDPQTTKKKSTNQKGLAQRKHRRQRKRKRFLQSSQRKKNTFKKNK